MHQLPGVPWAQPRLCCRLSAKHRWPRWYCAALPSKMVASPPLPAMASAAAVAQRLSARRGRRSWARWVSLTNGGRKIGISLQLCWLTGERKSYSGTARSVDANAHTMCYALRGFHARSRESWPRRRASSDAVLRQHEQSEVPTLRRDRPGAQGCRRGRRTNPSRCDHPA